MESPKTKDPAPRVSTGRAGIVEGFGQHFDADETSSDGKSGLADPVTADDQPIHPTFVGKTRGILVAKRSDWEVVESRLNLTWTVQFSLGKDHGREVWQTARSFRLRDDLVSYLTELRTLDQSALIVLQSLPSHVGGRRP